MKNKIATFLIWIASKLVTKPEEKVSYTALYDLMVEMYNNSPSAYSVDKELYSIMFNAKYSNYIGTLSPSNTLTSFYSRASLGDTSYIKEPLYRMMVLHKDIETRRLSNRLRRSQ